MPTLKSHQQAPGSTSKFRLLFIVFAASFVMNFAAYEICTTHARCWNSSPFASLFSNTVPLSGDKTARGEFVLRQTVHTSTTAGVRLDKNTTETSGFSDNSTSVINNNQTLLMDIKNETNATKLNNTSKVSENVLHKSSTLEKTLVKPMTLKTEIANCAAQTVIDSSLPPCYVQNSQCMQDTRLYKINMTKVSETEVIQRHAASLSSGGRWRSCDCKSQSKVAIIIPYRDRAAHLNVLLNNLIPFLQYQKRDFRIFIIEQNNKSLFNRAALINVGFVESQKLDNFDCFVSHDVDLIPIHLCNIYECSAQPRHLSAGYDKFRYRLPYGTFMGGCVAMDKKTIESINGLSNIMFGWGGEDDNTYARIHKKNYTVQRYKGQIPRYNMVKHGRDTANPPSKRSLGDVWDVSYMMQDGLSSLNYTVESIKEEPLYTRVTVDLPGPVKTDQIQSFFKAKKEYFQAKQKLISSK